MGLVLYNTLTRTKAPFEPLVPGRVGLYVCGPTVYDRAHIGNARPVVVFDVLHRLLRHLYPDVTYVRNITDIDDKIITAAQANNEPIEHLTRRTTAAFHADMAALNALAPTHEPRATAHVPGMIAMIGDLIASGHAYADQGHVLFHVPAMAGYGGLSRRNRDELVAGARVEVAPYKRDPADFVLWKPSPPELPGWGSPWGRGRPGWHIECSVMAGHHLGETFDIHGGGLDLIFPHHENEIAQSTCAHHGAPLARVWMHNGFVMVNGEKMSKSLGNFFTVRELLDEGWHGETIRLALLITHYRQPLDFTRAGLAQAKAVLDRWYTALRQADAAAGAGVGGGNTPPTSPAAALPPPPALLDALLDDLNLPQAIGAVHDLVAALNKAADAGERLAIRAALTGAAGLLGLLHQDPVAWLHGTGAGASGLAEAEIERLIDERQAARAARNFKEADRLRALLKDQGILLEDSRDGRRSTWRRE